MVIFKWLFNKKHSRKEFDENRLEEEKARIELEKIRLWKERTRLEEEKRQIELEKKILEDKIKNEKRRFDANRKLKEEKRNKEELEFWKEWALNKQKFLIEEEKQKIEVDNEIVIESLQVESDIMTDKNINSVQCDKAISLNYNLSILRSINEKIDEDKWNYDEDDLKDDQEISYNQMDYAYYDLEYQSFLKYRYDSNSSIPTCSISIDKVKKYNDSMYIKYGYENIGFRGLYEMFYYEDKFNYENYEDIMDYYSYINDNFDK